MKFYKFFSIKKFLFYINIFSIFYLPKNNGMGKNRFWNHDSLSEGFTMFLQMK